MPELPEVETICRRLEPLLLGKTIRSITIFHPKPFIGITQDIVDAQIVGVHRRAKIIQFDLDTQLHLLSHLKMTGQWIYTDDTHRVGGGHPTADWVQDLPSKHTRIMFELDGSAKLYFNDQRLFGWVKVMTPVQVQQEYQRLGPDVTNRGFTLEYFQQKVAHRRVPIKQLLMDTAVVCGVGNIYACDALHLAKVHPLRPALSLSSLEQQAVYQAVGEVIVTGIRLGGATIEHFRHVDGFAGSYQDVVRVYGKEGAPCIVCKQPIIKIKLGGRGTFLCPHCQPE